MTDKIVRLVDRAHVRTGSDSEILAWARGWLDQIEEDGQVRSLLLVVETNDGNVYHLGQTTHPAGSGGAARVLGLLHILVHKILHGRGHHPLLEEKDG